MQVHHPLYARTRGQIVAPLLSRVLRNSQSLDHLALSLILSVSMVARPVVVRPWQNIGWSVVGGSGMGTMLRLGVDKVGSTVV